MTRAPQHAFARWLEQLSTAVAHWAGGTTAFALAAGVVLAWLCSGPIFHYSDTWQLVINTGTTVVTFLMVFLIQRSQNKESLAVQLKLNELLAAVQAASNRLIDIENLSEQDLRSLHQHYEELAKLAARDSDVAQSHSVEEARQRHHRKGRHQTA